MPRTISTVTAAALLSISTAWASQTPTTAQAPPRPAPTTAAPPISSIPRATIERLLLVGGEAGSTVEFLGIHKFDDDVSMLSITSNRQGLAFASASAASKGGTYTPPAEMRRDLVTISCGDADIGERWDCGRITVMNATGRRVAPVSYTAGPSIYRNALGSTWTATRATAIFRLSELVGGFSVRYAGTDGTEFTQAVSAREVDHVLFAEMPATLAMKGAVLAQAALDRIAASEAERAAKAAAAAAAKKVLDAEPDPPALFRGTLDAAAGDTWTVTSASPGFTWQSCELVSGTARTALGPLAPGIPVTVARPRGGVASTVRPVVHCTAKGRKFEGPVPADFNISVERGSAEVWTVRNLSDYAWSGCEIVVAEKTASVSALPARGSVTVTAGNFYPGPPRADAAPSAASLKLTCVAYGQLVEATQKPAP